MSRSTVRRFVVLAVCLSLTTGCSRTSSSDDGSRADHPATVEPIAGTDTAMVTLTDKAAERIGLETAAVKDAPANAGHPERSVANAAVLYDPTGKAWVYVTQDHGSYLRTPIIIDRVVGDDALLSDGPPSGAEVVTTGAAELYGAESTFGED